MTGARRLTQREVSRSMTISMVEGVFYALMVGFGETYFLADAVRLKATPLQQGLVITLPLFAGAMGPVLGLWALARATRRKALSVLTALGEAAVLLSIAGADLAGYMTPALLIGAVCLYQMFGQALGTLWSSWYGDLVPREVRGRYFARRTRLVHLATCAGLITAGVLLQHLEPGAARAVAAGAGGTGFRIVFGLAGLFRFVSATLLLFSPEPRFRGLAGPTRTARFLRTERGGMAWRLLTAGCLLQLLVYVASPYFGPFMLTRLKLSYLEYMAASVAVVTVKFLLLPGWGKLVDQHGARSVYTLTALLVALVPLPWLWTRGLAWVIAAQALSGFSWGGYEVAFFSLVLEASYQGLRPYLFAAQNLLNGSAQLLGGLLGGLLFGIANRDYRILFAASLLGRLCIALLVPRLVPAGRTRPPIGRRVLLLRVIGLRPHGGFVHRPIPLDGEDPAGAAPRRDRA